MLNGFYILLKHMLVLNNLIYSNIKIFIIFQIFIPNSKITPKTKQHSISTLKKNNCIINNMNINANTNLNLNNKNSVNDLFSYDCHLQLSLKFRERNLNTNIDEYQQVNIEKGSAQTNQLSQHMKQNKQNKQKQQKQQNKQKQQKQQKQQNKQKQQKQQNKQKQQKQQKQQKTDSKKHIYDKNYLTNCKKQNKLNKQSKYFLRQIQKVLKENKLNLKQKNHNSSKSKININTKKDNQKVKQKLSTSKIQQNNHKMKKLQMEKKKLLSVNIKSQQAQIKQRQIQQKFNFVFDDIKFKTKISKKTSKSNSSIKKMLLKNQNKQMKIFQQFLTKVATTKLLTTAPQKPPPSIKEYNINTQISQLNPSHVNLTQAEQPNSINKINLLLQQFYTNQPQCHIVLQKKQQHNIKTQNDRQTIDNDESLNLIRLQDNKESDIGTMKLLSSNNFFKKARFKSLCSSRLMQDRTIKTKTNKNKQIDNQLLITRKQLKKAISIVTLKSCNKDIEDQIITQNKKQLQENNSEIQDIRKKPYQQRLYSKIAQKMQGYKKQNLVKKLQTNDIKVKHSIIYENGFQKPYVIQERNTFIVQASNLILKQHQLMNSFRNKCHTHRMTYTMLSKTGLEIERKEDYIKTKSDQNRKKRPSTGGRRQDNYLYEKLDKKLGEYQILEQPKSQIIIKKLRKQFGPFSNSKRPNTCRTTETKQYRNKMSNFCQQFLTHRQSYTSTPNYSNFNKIEYENVTRKQVQKQQLKQKIISLMIDCDRVKKDNQQLKRGIDIFENYCGNLDDGLNGITENIDLFISNIQ